LKNRRKDALISVKKSLYFGSSNQGQYPADFEWPTLDDILTMPFDKPLRAVALKWHNADYDRQGNYIGAI
jgi:hypothetical protein